jgi:type IV secretion system protein TrbF
MTTGNPYLSAQQIWLERYGDYISRELAWRRLALLSSVVAAMSVGGLVYIGTRSKFVPYIIEVDRLGYPVGTRIVEQSSTIRDARVVKAYLAEFVTNVRRVSGDGAEQKTGILRAFEYLDNQYPAKGVVVDYLKQTEPFKRAAHELIGVQIESVVQTAPDRFAIEWTESEKERNGHEKGRSSYQASISVVFADKAVSDPSVTINPLGMTIVSIDWARKRSVVR